jgi:hypothetical protein
MKTILLAGIAALSLSIGTAFATANPDGSAAQATNGRASPPPTAAHHTDRIISKFYR